MAKPTAKIATKAQSDEADKANNPAPANFDNVVGAISLTEMMATFREQAKLADRYSINTEQVAAAMMLVHYHKKFGHIASLAADMARLSNEAVGADKFGGAKLRNAYVKEVMTAAGMTPAHYNADSLTTEEKAINKREYDNTFKLFSRGLDFACMLVSSSMDETHQHLAGYVYYSWYNADTMRFSVRWDALISKGAEPSHRLWGLVYGLPGARPPVPANPDYLVPLDGAIYMEQSTTEGATPVEIKATPARIKTANATKRTSDPAVLRERDTAPAGDTGTGEQAEGDTRDDDTNGDDAATPGRPDNSAVPPDAGKPVERALKPLLAAIFEILRDGVMSEPRTGNPSEHFWSNMPDRELLEGVERCLRAIRIHAQEFEAKHTVRPPVTNKGTLPPLPSLQTPPDVALLPASKKA